MAADTIGFLETVVGGPAHLVGFSDGGIVALIVAMTRPDLVHNSLPSVRTSTPRGSFLKPQR